MKRTFCWSNVLVNWTNAAFETPPLPCAASLTLSCRLWALQLLPGCLYAAEASRFRDRPGPLEVRTGRQTFPPVMDSFRNLLVQSDPRLLSTSAHCFSDSEDGCRSVSEVEPAASLNVPSPSGWSASAQQRTLVMHLFKMKTRVSWAQWLHPTGAGATGLRQVSWAGKVLERHQRICWNLSLHLLSH